jgi:asparagine synthase (glutamine-hydrolysing)
VTTFGDASIRTQAVTDALVTSRHRGPDAAGTWHDDDVVLGFNRLSVIDVEGSHQPLHWDPDADQDAPRYTIVFNGEVYNFPELRAELAQRHGARFRTAGDTEVVVAAVHHWGPDAVSRLRGMFAFLVWDRRERVLVGARDPFGVKPLYVAVGPAGVAFASEKRNLVELAPVLGVTDREPDAAVDVASVQDYFRFQYVPEPATLHPAVRRVESGTHLSVRPGGPVHRHRYFTPVLHTDAAADPAVHTRIADALADSVARHMRADVPVGTFLSGGIDSTAITALAARIDPDLVAFTAGFDHAGYSEVDVAAESAAALGVRHVVRLVGADEVVAALPTIVWHLDDPLADPALVPLWFLAREARREVTVVLSGEGADELFGGYAIYREPRSLAAFELLPDRLRAVLGRLSDRLPEGVRGKDLLRRGALRLEDRHYGNARILREGRLAGLLRTYDPARTQAAITAAHYRESVGWDPVSRMQHVDLFTWLRGDILVKADRMTMAHSLELRVPFLDPAVFAVAAGLPRSDKLHRSTTKVALRRALAEIVPEHVLHRPKLGFPVPIRHWLRAELHDWARSVIADSAADHLVDLAAAADLLERHRSGPVDHSRAVWAVLVFLIWHGLFVERRLQPQLAEPAQPVRR